MKKIIITFASLLLSLNMFSQSFINNLKDANLICDISAVGGVYGYSEGIYQPVFGADLTFFGLMFGWTEYKGETTYISQPVHVDSYTKKDGTHVSSYNRSKPGHKGNYHTEFLGAEAYMGFWIPAVVFKNGNNLYASPIIGITGQMFGNDFTYGAGLKYIINDTRLSYGFTLKVTKYSIDFGISIAGTGNARY